MLKAGLLRFPTLMRFLSAASRPPGLDRKLNAFRRGVLLVNIMLRNSNQKVEMASRPMKFIPACIMSPPDSVTAMDRCLIALADCRSIWR